MDELLAGNPGSWCSRLSGSDSQLLEVLVEHLQVNVVSADHLPSHRWVAGDSCVGVRWIDDGREEACLTGSLITDDVARLRETAS
jgi:hypothetical protein